jgi:hypothetical protein
MVNGDSRCSADQLFFDNQQRRRHHRPAHQIVIVFSRTQWGMSRICLLKVSNTLLVLGGRISVGNRFTHASIAPAVVPAIREWMGFSFLDIMTGRAEWGQVRNQDSRLAQLNKQLTQGMVYFGSQRGTHIRSIGQVMRRLTGRPSSPLAVMDENSLQANSMSTTCQQLELNSQS